MNEIICPNCNRGFKLDETGYANILKQVRDYKFDEEIQARLELANKEKDSAPLTPPFETRAPSTILFAS